MEQFINPLGLLLAATIAWGFSRIHPRNIQTKGNANSGTSTSFRSTIKTKIFDPLIAREKSKTAMIFFSVGIGSVIAYFLAWQIPFLSSYLAPPVVFEQNKSIDFAQVIWLAECRNTNTWLAIGLIVFIVLAFRTQSLASTRINALRSYIVDERNEDDQGIGEFFLSGFALHQTNLPKLVSNSPFDSARKTVRELWRGEWSEGASPMMDKLADDFASSEMETVFVRFRGKQKVFAGPLLAFLLILSGLLCIWALFQIEHCGIQ